MFASNPRIVYARGSGYGQKGPEAEKGGFDAITYWYRSGLGAALTPDGGSEVVSMVGPAFGDIQAATKLLNLRSGSAGIHPTLESTYDWR